MNANKHNNYCIMWWAWRQRRLAALLYLRLQKNKHKRRFWVREIYKKRKQQGAFHNLVLEMRENDHELYFNYLRMLPQEFDELLSTVGPLLKKIYHTREPVSPSERLAVTLRFLASGDSMMSISYAFRLGKNTVSCIIQETCTAIWNALVEDVLPTPTSDNWLEICGRFEDQWNMPNCIGAIDGKHIVMQAPPNTGSDFYNYKGSFSIVLMALCDADYCFTLVDIGAKGRQSDGGVFRNSMIGQMLLSDTLNIPPPKSICEPEEDFIVPHYIVGDAAFPLNQHLMKPYPGRFLPQEKRIFNYRLSRARRVVENSFGILAAKWRILRKPIIAKVDTVEGIVKAVICLHNWLRRRDLRQATAHRYIRIGLADGEDADGNVVDGEWRTEGNINNLFNISLVGGNRYSNDARIIRDTIAKSFLTNNAIPNQWTK